MSDVLTDSVLLKNLYLTGYVQYCYVSVIGNVNYVNRLKEVSKVLVPTVERSIVENIKYDLEFIDEG